MNFLHKALTTLQKNVLHASQASLTVLMYHKVTSNLKKVDDLTISVTTLENQFQYLKNSNYTIISIQELTQLLLEDSFVKNTNYLLLTFDDGYLNNYELAFPLLQHYQLPALIFLPTAYIGKTSAWDTNAKPIMSLPQIQNSPIGITYALHSHTHLNFQDQSITTIKKELESNINFFQKNNISSNLSLAYPYGGRPKNTILKKKLFQLLKSYSIPFAFRIGNKINALPLKNNYEIHRIDIKGKNTLENFKNKLNYSYWV